MLSSRKIHDEFNIFEGITSNLMYIVIWIIIAGGQAVIVMFGGIAFKCSDKRPAVTGI